MTTLTLPKPRGFRLKAATAFYESFIPGCDMAAAATTSHLTLAFRLEGTHEAVAVALTETDDALRADIAGTEDEAAAAKQVVRMLGLDADGDAWRAVGDQDPVVGRLQVEFPGFFTAAKASPYDAATWAILAPRVRMKAAATLKMAIAERDGDDVTLHGRTHSVFPSARALACLKPFPGLPEEKRKRLQGIGRAALDGRLDADRLLALGEQGALTDLMTLRGVGPWAASHIFFRGAAPPDALPTAEPRVLHGVAAAYGLTSQTLAAFRQVAETWRPFRMWVCILMARHLAGEGGWNASGLRRERAAAGRLLARRTSATLDRDDAKT